VQSAGDLKKWYRLHAPSVAGIDEAGRGPLAGPVVAAAVVLDTKHRIVGLNDSKKVPEKKRELLFDKITKSARAFGIGILNAQRVDEVNILRASLLAMKAALDDLQSKIDWPVTGALVDGNQRAPLPRSVLQFTVVDGDALWPVIMAASILAKVTRDRMMLEFDAQYPGYGFAEHKGYATPTHLEALKRLGPSPIHRLSFAPIKVPDDSQVAFSFFGESHAHDQA
jgi:ribonuclease HII